MVSHKPYKIIWSWNSNQVFSTLSSFTGIYKLKASFSADVYDHTCTNIKYVVPVYNHLKIWPLSAVLETDLWSLQKVLFFLYTHRCRRPAPTSSYLTLFSSCLFCLHGIKASCTPSDKLAANRCILFSVDGLSQGTYNTPKGFMKRNRWESLQF